MRLSRTPFALQLHNRTKIRPGAETAAVASDDDASQGAISAYPIDNFCETGQQIRRHAIAIIRSIECDDAYCVFAMEQYRRRGWLRFMDGHDASAIPPHLLGKTMAEPLIEISAVTRHYRMGDELIKALDGVSFAIERGEMLAIVGSSGSGKSTLMNILGCLDVATSGTYRLRGRDVKDLSDDELSTLRNREIGFIFQNFQLLSRSSALRNVELPLLYRGVPPKKRRELATAALARVGLGGRMKHKPNQLSGGQRQRVAVARALVAEPSLLLADEPTGNLDSATGREIMGLFHELHQAGNTIIMVTHEPAIAAQCPRAIRVLDGHIVDDGPGPRVAADLAAQHMSAVNAQSGAVG